jgi:hypothetical protein
MNENYRVIRLVCWILMILPSVSKVWAQVEEPTAYYLNVNQSSHYVHEIKGDVLALQYTDSYGQWKELPVTIYNWKREKIAQLNLSKSFGLNNFVINLFEVNGTWELNKIYTLEITDERNHKLETLIKLIPKPEDGPEVNIVVNPIQFKCDLLSPKLMDFYGEIKGGKAPYKTQWYVLNEQRNDFLYQPREEVIPSAGKTMVISVDKSPDYYVILYVTDACGNKEERTMHVVCEDGKKKINTLFIEPIDKKTFYKGVEPKQ